MVGCGGLRPTAATTRWLIYVQGQAYGPSRVGRACLPDSRVGRACLPGAMPASFCRHVDWRVPTGWVLEGRHACTKMQAWHPARNHASSRWEGRADDPSIQTDGCTRGGNCASRILCDGGICAGFSGQDGRGPERRLWTCRGSALRIRLHCGFGVGWICGDTKAHLGRDTCLGNLYTDAGLCVSGTVFRMAGFLCSTARCHARHSWALWNEHCHCGRAGVGVLVEPEVAQGSSVADNSPPSPLPNTLWIFSIACARAWLRLPCWGIEWLGVRRRLAGSRIGQGGS